MQYLLERSLEVSSQEMRKLYDELKAETEQRIEALHKSEQNPFHGEHEPRIAHPDSWDSRLTEIVKNTKLEERQQLFVETAYASCEICWM